MLDPLTGARQSKKVEKFPNHKKTAIEAVLLKRLACAAQRSACLNLPAGSAAPEPAQPGNGVKTPQTGRDFIT
ncbi:hypothetical protein GO613_06545 [Azoarcus communis]|uniref:hypothetical protein n=1 Tax=Parazoarcus communis TaxID=41977 RepID=UPI00105821E1|nr:hypothetical protein [Parazoarcus communis]NMG47756.1 hypothetical protein [Parazoarcus communis]NMG68807.1 hypothetical protein [Parazoarcus communis SWub3 = DSM 12120]